jgi:phosphoesterase RecJ-like protein
LSQNDIEKLIELFKNPKKIVISSHYNPDGDAVGSAMALYHVLKQLNHQVSVIFPNKFPLFLSWIEESERSLIFEQDGASASQVISAADIIFCVDYNSFKRLGEMESLMVKSKAIKVLIDHHPDPEKEHFGFVYHSASASSTAELVYKFLKLTGLHIKINRQVAESLYAGIITDTGSLSFSCNNPDTYIIIAKLIQKGLDAERAHRLIYDDFSENRMRLLGYTIYQKMIVIPEYFTAIIALTIDELARFGYQQGDTEGIVNFPLSMKAINFSVMLVERTDRIRLSFRSKGSFPANTIAARYFEGGGHLNAAGGDSYLSMQETIKRLKEILPQYYDQLNFEIR